MLTKKLYRMISPRLSTGMHDVVKNKSSTLSTVHRSGVRIRGGVLDASVLTSRECLKGGGGHLVRDRVCFFWDKCPGELRGQKQRNS